MTDEAAPFADLPPSLQAERHGAVAVLRLNRAAKRNALDDTMVAGLESFFSALPDDIRAVVVPVLRHRLVLSYRAEAEGVRDVDVLEAVVSAAG